MLCPKYKGKAKVTNTTQSKDGMETTRYHTCIKCNHKFNTNEKLPSGWKYEERYKELVSKLFRLYRDFEGG